MSVSHTLTIDARLYAHELDVYSQYDSVAQLIRRFKILEVSLKYSFQCTNENCSMKEQETRCTSPRERCLISEGSGKTSRYRPIIYYRLNNSKMTCILDHDYSPSVRYLMLSDPANTILSTSLRFRHARYMTFSLHPRRNSTQIPAENM
jgi:hypothetical protein